jgi:hypothetical protein
MKLLQDPRVNLNSGTDLHARRARSELIYRIENKRDVALLQVFLDRFDFDINSYNHLLLKAATSNSLDMLTFLFEDALHGGRIQIDVTSYHVTNALIGAARNNHWSVIEYFLKYQYFLFPQHATSVILSALRNNNLNISTQMLSICDQRKEKLEDIVPLLDCARVCPQHLYHLLSWVHPIYLVHTLQNLMGRRYSTAIDLLTSSDIWTDLYTDIKDRYAIVTHLRTWISYAPERITHIKPKSPSGSYLFLESVSDETWHRIIAFVAASRV